MATTLINLHNYIHKESDFAKGSDFVLIDRRGIFGSPFKISSKCTRKKSVALYRKYFGKRINTDRYFRKAVEKLRGRKLACWCTPLACHGDVIIEWLEKNE